MTRTVNVVFQLLALVVQYGNMATGVVPAKYQTYVSLAVGLAQAAVAWKAHGVNPDGTNAAVAYIPPSK